MERELAVDLFERMLKAVDAAGGRQKLADAVGVSYHAVAQWQRVPAKRVRAVEDATGIDRAEIRPDIYGEG